MPSIALRCACAVPLIWLRIFSEIARPAASSAALLMRRPDESFCMLFESDICVASRLRCALKASTLVLTRRDMVGLLGRFAGDIRVGGGCDFCHPLEWVRASYFG